MHVAVFDWTSNPNRSSNAETYKLERKRKRMGGLTSCKSPKDDLLIHWPEQELDSMPNLLV